MPDNNVLCSCSFRDWDAIAGRVNQDLVLGAWCSCSQIAVRANRDIVPAAWWRCCCSFWRWTGVLRFLLGQKVLGDLGWRAAKWMMEGESFVYSLPILTVTADFKIVLNSCLKVRANKRGNTCAGSTFGCFAANPESGNYEFRGVRQIVRSAPSWRQNNGS